MLETPLDFIQSMLQTPQDYYPAARAVVVSVDICRGVCRNEEEDV